MDNDELLLKIKDMFDTKVDEVKRHIEVISEKLESKVQIVAEGHEISNKKFDALDKKVEDIKNDIAVVKDYVIGVDAKLNEHEIILKRVK